MSRSTTLHDVAKAVGVSARTVSRAVNGEPGLSAATRRRVLAAVDAMDYRPNMLAKGLKANRTHSIALVVTDLTDPFFPVLAHSIQQRAAASDHTLVLASTQDDEAAQARVLTSLRARGIDGLITFPSGQTELDDIRALIGPAVPIVAMDDNPLGVDQVVCVQNDLEGGARMAVDHLLALGHRRIAKIGHAGHPERKRERERGYRAAMTDAGLGADMRVEGDHPTVPGGYAAMQRLLQGGSAPTAILGYNDLMAIGAMQAAREAGLALPADLSIVGFDDIEMAALVTPPLTTVRIDRERLGRVAAERLLEMIETPDGEPVSTGHVRLDVQLVVRESTTRPPPRPTPTGRG